jgi:hypothetical protein
MTYPYNLSQSFIYNKLTDFTQGMSNIEGKFRHNYLNWYGDCNGWAFLFAYYNNVKRGQEFTDILTYISKWDGRISSLYSNDGMSNALKAKYDDGISLFEQTINDVTWFSQNHSRAFINYKLTQDDRILQWECAGDHQSQLHNIFQFLHIGQKNYWHGIDYSELADMLKIAHQWTDSWLDIGVYSDVGGHALSVYISPDGTYSFYDCNEPSGAFVSDSPIQISSKIWNSLGWGNSDIAVLDFSLYQFTPMDYTISDDYTQSLDISCSAADHFLSLATDNRNYEAISMVLSSDDKNRTSLVKSLGNSILIKCAEDNQVDLAEFLLNHGVDVNYRSWHQQNKTPLMFAAEKGNREMATLLIEYGANINMQSNWGSTALSLAKKNHHDQLALYLESFNDKNTILAIDDLIDMHQSAIPGLEAQAPSPIQTTLNDPTSPLILVNPLLSVSLPDSIIVA